MAAIIEPILMAFLIITISVCQSMATGIDLFFSNETAAAAAAHAEREYRRATLGEALVSFFVVIVCPCLCLFFCIALIVMCINDLERSNRSQVVYVQRQGQPMYVTQATTGNAGQGGAPVVIYNSVPASTVTARPVVVYTPAPSATPAAVYRPAPAATPKAGQTPTPVVSPVVTPTVTPKAEPSAATRAAPEVIGGSATDSTETRRSN